MNEFFHAVMHAPVSFDKPPDMRLPSVKEESDASRLRSPKSCLCDDCPFFVSMMFSCGRKGGICVEVGGRHGRKGDR